MPKKGYNLNNIESVCKRFVASTNHPTVSVLNDLKRELNSLFTEAKCEEIIYTKNTDKLFFGMRVYPLMDGEDAMNLIQEEHPVAFNRYYVEFDDPEKYSSKWFAYCEIKSIFSM